MPEGFGRASGDLHIAAAWTAALPLVVLLVSTFSLASPQGQSSAPGVSQAQIHLELGEAALKANAPATAVKEFHEVLVLDPRNAEAYADLGVVAFFERDYPQASKYLGSALAIDPSLVKVQALLGICQKILGKGSAQALLEKSFPRLQDKRLRTQVGMELAGIYYQEGDLYRASSVVRTLVDLDPDNVNVLYMAQRVYSDLAHETLNKLAVLAPGSARMEQVIAERLVNEGDAQGAIEHYQKALEIDPHLAGVHFELGEAILQSSSHDPKAQAKAKMEFEIAAKTEGDSAGIESQLGRIALLQLNLQQALAHYRRALVLNPDDSEAALGMGKVLLNAQKPEEAVKYLSAAAQSDPLSSEAHYQLAIAYRDLHMTAEAQKELRTFKEIEQTMDQVRKLYRQMNRPTFPGEQSAKLPSER